MDIASLGIACVAAITVICFLVGQIVKASIVLTKGTEATEELKKEVQEYVKKRTAPYKYPRIVVFRDELPKTVSGKIQRNLL